MTTAKIGPKTLVEAVQALFDALEPFDEAARQRILTSAVSLLGSRLPPAVSPTSLPSSVGAASSHASRPASERPLSPVELIQQKQPATNPQRIALFAYYRERVEGISRFSKDDLKQYFAKAKEPPPKNFDRDYRAALKMGWIYDDGADSYLTSKGLEAVEAGFGGKPLPRGVAATKKGKSKKGAKPKKGSTS
jgi:hypothetical protein